MSWNDFYQRQRAIQAVLEHASRAPDSRLIAAPEGFSDTDELLAALQYKWTQAIEGRIEIALEDHSHADRVQAVTTAWRAARAANTVLRAVLDRHSDEPGPNLRAALDREHRLLALAAGLAERGEPDEAVSRVGSAFLHLLRAAEPPLCGGALGKLRGLIPSR